MIHVERNHNIEMTTVRVPHSDWKVFQEMVHRGTNLWPDAPPEIKHFADMITVGHSMQDYFKNPHLAGKGKPLNADKA